MADRLDAQVMAEEILLTQGVYMCYKAHKQYATDRISRGRSTLVFARVKRALAASVWLSIVAHRAVYSR
jgi:hypothetical protein